MLSRVRMGSCVTIPETVENMVFMILIAIVAFRATGRNEMEKSKMKLVWTGRNNGIKKPICVYGPRIRNYTGEKGGKMTREDFLRWAEGK